jgi:hypothetical protein
MDEGREEESKPSAASPRLGDAEITFTTCRDANLCEFPFEK